MIYQCRHCGKKVDSQEECYESVQHAHGKWDIYHTLCIDTLRSIEKRRDK